MSIRALILAGCLALTALTALVGGLAYRAEQDLGALALQIYDRSFMGMNYLRSAQVGFVSLAGSRERIDKAAMAAVLEDLQVARDRAISPASAALAGKLAQAVGRLGDGATEAMLQEVQAQFEQVVEGFAGDGFRYRRTVGDVVAREIWRGAEALGLVLLAALGITVVLGRLIVPPLRRAVQVAASIAGGKLDNVLAVSGPRETAQLLQALSLMQGSIAGALARIRALMDQQAASHAGALATEQSRLEAALENMNQGLCLFGANGRLAVANRRYVAMFGPATPGERVEAVMERSGLALLGDTLHRAIEAELSFDLADGRSLAISQRPVEGGGWVITFEDATERRAAEARLAHAARHDPLTGLPNRLLLGELIQRASIRNDADVALFCIGLDRFKAVNESLGHAVGDAVLCEVADRLRRCVAEGDKVFRLGGDEFALLQAGSSQPSDASGLGRSIQECLVAPLEAGVPLEAGGQALTVGASIGIAIAGDGSSSGEALLKCAGLAMHRAKLDGRGTIRFFASEMDAAMRSRRGLEADLRAALGAGQFEVFYQPLVQIGGQVGAQVGGIAGFEALLRWRHPERGLVSPAVFIPVAEETGLIEAIGAWVMRQACRDAAGWPGTLKVAVNLSPKQFAGGGVAAVAAGALRDAGLAASRLELEITESALMDDGDEVSSTLAALRKQGIRIAMDDFGTGFSSLGYLLRFRFDKIKVDQSFVRAMTEQEDSLAIVRAVLGLGRALGIMVNAEGVETAGQLEALRREGCAEVQGYLFDKPRPGCDVPEMLRRHGNATLPPEQVRNELGRLSSRPELTSALLQEAPIAVS